MGSERESLLGAVTGGVCAGPGTDLELILYVQ